MDNRESTESNQTPDGMGWIGEAMVAASRDGLKNLAIMTAIFFNELAAQGIDEEIAAQMTTEIISTMISNAVRQAS